MDEGPSKDQLKTIIENYKNGHMVETLAPATYLLAQFPTSVVLYNFIGLCHTSLGNSSTAIETYNLIIAMDPGNPNNHFNLANIYMDNENFTAAIAGYKKVLEINPTDFGACHNMGICWEQVGNVDNAIDCFQQAVDINPEFVLANQKLRKAIEEKESSDITSNQ